MHSTEILDAHSRLKCVFTEVDKNLLVFVTLLILIYYQMHSRLKNSSKKLCMNTNKTIYSFFYIFAIIHQINISTNFP